MDNATVELLSDCVCENKYLQLNFYWLYGTDVADGVSLHAKDGNTVMVTVTNQESKEKRQQNLFQVIILVAKL